MYDHIFAEIKNSDILLKWAELLLKSLHCLHKMLEKC